VRTALIREVARQDVDTLTPVEALVRLHELRRQARSLLAEEETQ
jgi:hypothetical protein